MKINNKNVNNKYGFTLSEVLITLVVIGVIAAITIPVIMADHREKAMEAKYLKSKSTIANAMKLLMIDSGTTDIASSDLIKCYDSSGATRASCLKNISKRIFNITYDSVEKPAFLTQLKSKTYKTAYDQFTFIPAVYAATPTHSGGSNGGHSGGNYEGSNNSSSSSINPWNNVSFAFVVGDGITYGYENNINSTGDDVGFYMIADLNEKSMPNRAGYDLYKFLIDVSGKLTDRTCEYTSSCDSNNSSQNEGSGSNGSGYCAPAPPSHSGGYYGGHSGGSCN